MARSVQLKAELEDEHIVVTLPGTRFRVAYRKHPDGFGLLQAPGMASDSKAPITRHEFEAMAWAAANAKARELGWQV
jgi:hypothetical protein